MAELLPPEVEVRRAALRCVLSTKDHVDLSAVDRLLSDSDPAQRVLATVAIWQRQEARGRRMLLTLAAHSEADMRRHLAIMVGEQRNRSLKPVLIGMLDDVAEVRLAAADSLMEVVDDDVAVLRARQLATSQQRVKFWRNWTLNH